jgi:hypothetical protein
MKNLFFIASALFLVLGCGQTEKPNQTQNPVAAPVAIKADVLTREYKDNELAADEKYKNKVLEVSGKISNIAEVMGNITVDLEGHKENGVNIISVQCSFPQSEKPNLTKLKTGQNITFQGTNEGMTLNLYVGLADCKIK